MHLYLWHIVLDLFIHLAFFSDLRPVSHLCNILTDWSCSILPCSWNPLHAVLMLNALNWCDLCAQSLCGAFWGFHVNDMILTVFSLLILTSYSCSVMQQICTHSFKCFQYQLFEIYQKTPLNQKHFQEFHLIPTKTREFLRLWANVIPLLLSPLLDLLKWPHLRVCRFGQTHFNIVS